MKENVCTIKILRNVFPATCLCVPVFEYSDCLSCRTMECFDWGHNHQLYLSTPSFLCIKNIYKKKINKWKSLFRKHSFSAYNNKINYVHNKSNNNSKSSNDHSTTEQPKTKYNESNNHHESVNNEYIAYNSDDAFHKNHAHNDDHAHYDDHAYNDDHAYYDNHTNHVYNTSNNDKTW